VLQPIGSSKLLIYQIFCFAKIIDNFFQMSQVAPTTKKIWVEAKGFDKRAEVEIRV
jgi:hypothetical protein